MASTSTLPPLLPKKIQPKPTTPSLYLLPVSFAQIIAGDNIPKISLRPVALASNQNHDPPAAPPPPPPSLLKQPRRRIPILIDQKSIKKNLQINKETLQTKLASRPEPTQLIERGILRSEEEKLRRFQHRENIRSHIEKRPTREDLVTQGILLSDACVDPLIQVRGQLLKRNKLVDNLNNKLRKRPGPLELVNRKILQVDAELEQAIQEGRLPFTPTLSSNNFFDTSGESTAMISTMIHPIRHEESQYTNATSTSLSASGPKAKVRKKSQQLHRTPYDTNSINSGKIVKLKAIASNKRSTVESIGNLENSTSSNNLSDYAIINPTAMAPMETDDIHDSSMHSETNYEITLKQQQLFLQWQDDHCSRNPLETNAVTPAMSSTTSNCSTPLQSNDTQSIHSSRSSFSASSNQGNTRFSSVYSSSVSPQQDATIHLPIVEPEKARSKLADFKVNDLKVECKKRNLPVSGAKPQLLERLKPFEDAVFATLSSMATTPVSTATSLPSECSEASTTSAGTCQNACNHTQTIYCQTKPSLPAQDVINEYLQQCQPQSQQKPLVLQLPPNSKPPQLVQLVDSNGTVVGVAAMPQTITTTQPTPTKVAPCYCNQCKKAPGTHISAANNATETVVQTTSQVVAEPKASEPTFSFSQMGSGGQFTLVNASPTVTECRQMAPNCAGCIAAAASQPTIKIVTSEHATSTPRTTTASTASQQSAPYGGPLIRSLTSSTMNVVPKAHTNLQKSESHSSTVEQTIAAVAHRRHSIPASVFPQHEEVAEKVIASDDSIPSPGLSYLSTQDLDDAESNTEEIDPSVLLTAKTFSQHEDNLRVQQRIIAGMQEELGKVQEQLRKEQKLVIAARKAQLRTDKSTGKQCSQADILLNNLDVKQINKQHIQHFIQHKSQQQSVQNQINEFEKLSQVEQKLQEELHIEQAVQDIVRLIKSDGRTALLIVQLLRRYQLERNNQLQQAQQQKPKITSSTSGQNDLIPGSNQQELSGRTSVMSSKSAPIENGCCQQVLQVQTTDTCCSNRRCNQQQKSAQIVVIDDSPAASPAVPTTVVETTPKPQAVKESRSKSQNPRSNKRKSNGSRSIWAKTNLIEKSASCNNASATASKVDMEEIFRSVIDGSHPTTAASADAAPVDSQHAVIRDASSDLVPQLNGFHLVTSSDENSNSGMGDEQMDHTTTYVQVPITTASNAYGHDYIVHQPMQTEICSTTAVFIHPENISSCHVDCYSKPRNENSPERVEIIGNGHEFIPAANVQHYEYPKNEDFEDLMDVLRDDQDNETTNMDQDGRELLGYTSAELATFLAAECENGVTNGNIYESYVVNSGQEQYPQVTYQQCIQQQPTVIYEHQGNVQYETNAQTLDQALHIEPHQEQAIDDILNGEMVDPNVDWFDDYFHSPMANGQITACGSNRPSTASIQRPMDTFV